MEIGAISGIIKLSTKYVFDYKVLFSSRSSLPIIIERKVNDKRFYLYNKRNLWACGFEWMNVYMIASLYSHNFQHLNTN